VVALNKKWELAKPVPPAMLQRFPDLPPLLVQLLYNRGLEEVPEIEDYLSEGYDPGNPFLLAGMNRAVDRVRRAIRRGEPIIVYGDFDVDGITATTLLVQVLRVLGARVQPYIPNRFEEGYGLNRHALTHFAQKGARLVITVDCGTRAHAEIGHGNALGLDMIVTDHHDIREGEGLPPALAVINPKRRDSRYPFRSLSGVGVAFKLADALLRVNRSVPLHPLQTPLTTDDLLDLVALGTVADIVPLRGENRFLVRSGLAQLRRTTRPGLRALMATARTRPSDLDTDAIGYRLGPRLNAAGRLETATLAYSLLSTTSEEEATRLATRLEGLNRERRALTESMLNDARDQVQTRAGEAILIASGEAYHPGVAGLVASKLREEFYRPSVVIEVGERESTGSARSIPGFHITHALDRCGELLVKHGGHAMAAGFTVENDYLETLQRRLRQVAREQIERDKVDLTPKLHIDTELRPDQLTFDTLRLVDLLRPFGVENEEPLFLTRNLTVRDVSIIRDKHIRLSLSDGKLVWRGIAFRQAARAPEIKARVDVVYHLQRDIWNGEEYLQLHIVDLRPSTS